MDSGHPPQAAESFIAANLTLSTHPDDKRIRLYLARPDSGLWRLAAEAGDASPFWAFYWAGGGALVRHIAENPGLVRGKRVLDFGAGGGAVGVAAMRAGARSVCFVESNTVAHSAIALNCAANGFEAYAVSAQIAEASLAVTDLLLAGDVFYDAAIAAVSLQVIAAAAGCDVPVLVGDPLRRHLPCELFAECAHHDVHDFGVSTTVVGYVLEPRGPVET